MRTKLLMIILSTIMASPPVAAEQEREKPHEISVDLHIRAEWLKLAPVTDDVNRVATWSAQRILRALDPKTWEPYDDSQNVFPCDLKDLRRTFHIEKNEFLLGEPILVEFRIKLEGQGTWRERIGGNYRARGRDDNFLFLMRRKDGRWVRDPYGPIQYYMGGISSSYTVEQNQPMSYWHPVQRWCAVNRPGEYDLYCFQSAHEDTVVGQHEARIAGLPKKMKEDHFLNGDGTLIDSRTGKRSERYSIILTWRRQEWDASPLMEDIPTEVAEYAAKSWGVESTAGFAHFRVVIKKGSKVQRDSMLAHWTKFLEGNHRQEWPTGRRDAARQAICFSQQDDFLPLIENWIATASQPSDFHGLAMRPSRKATAMLLKAPNPNAIAAMRYLHPDRVPDVIPQLIRWVTHENNRVRTEAEARLRMWTGQGFHRNWKGYHRQRPTPEEARKMQPAWKEWWQKNKKNFKPNKQ